MKKVVVLSESGELKKTFLSLENHYICEVITFNYEQSHVFETLLSDDESLVLLSIANWENFKNFFDVHRMKINGTVVLVGDNESLNSSALKKLCEVDRFLKGVINTSLDFDMNRPWFNLLINPQVSSIDQEDLEEVGENLERVLGTALNELKRLKEVHEKLVPIREEKFKGLSATSKFGAGESAGGEFFDILSNDREVLLLLARSRSYLVSSMIMSGFDELRSAKHFSDELVNNFLSKVQSDVDSSKVNESKRKLDILFLRVDLKTMKARTWKSGDSILLNDSQLVSESEFTIERGEKLMILSSGLVENQPGKTELVSKSVEKRSKSCRDILDEVFYTLKREKNGMFFSHDATMIIFEVDKNAILQI
ncbi:hypothetical protein A9Q84_07105 [Halobacteriovorax marinus]|uniref:PPM-type phosphatase domain-containing protein n=1 Tax=Halobacteriovorax marinus TaxID=97084 RepID=A0A1Y5F5Q5_9BACT|nr:hypothetical protein A9Q84_07105 [Halobacteriovorax marinus]